MGYVNEDEAMVPSVDQLEVPFSGPYLISFFGNIVNHNS